MSTVLAMARSLRTRLSANDVVIGFALIILTSVVILAFIGGLIAPIEASRQSLRARLSPPGTEGQGMIYWLGTDPVGRDLLSMILTGARPALIVSVSAVSIAAIFGVSFGMLAGYRKGRIADALMYTTNIQLAFPFFLLAITIVGILRPSLPLVIFVIALGCWVPFARIAFSETLQIAEQEFIEAVQVMRGSSFRILVRHVLPNILPNITVLGTFSLGSAIVMESGLSFVGLGVPTTSPTWGRMLSEGRDYMQTSWWLTVVPGAAIFLLVLSINLLGERMRDITDPRMRSR